MKVENQVCTLEQAKKLRQLGVVQQGIWTWVFPALSKMLSTTYGVYHYSHAKEIIDENEGTEFDHDCASAYTVAELGQMLPDWMLRNDIDADMKAGRAMGVWPTGSNWGARMDRGYQCEWFPTEAEARAYLLIKLIESKLVTIEEVNKRLQQ